MWRSQNWEIANRYAGCGSVAFQYQEISGGTVRLVAKLKWTQCGDGAVKRVLRFRNDHAVSAARRLHGMHCKQDAALRVFF